MSWLEVCCLPWRVCDKVIPEVYFCLTDGGLFCLLGCVTKGKTQAEKYSITIIAMHVDTICAFTWMHRYVESRSASPTRMHFEGHLMHIAAIMWSILKRKSYIKTYGGCPLVPGCLRTGLKGLVISSHGRHFFYCSAPLYCLLRIILLPQVW